MKKSKKALDILATLSTFITLLSTSIVLHSMLSLVAYELREEGEAASLAFDKKEIVFGIIFFAAWTFLYYYLAKEYIPKIIAFFSSVLFLTLAYFSMLYTIREVGYEKVATVGWIVTLFVLEVIPHFFPNALKKLAHLVLTDFLGLKNLRSKCRILLLAIFPVGLYNLLIMPVVFTEAFEVLMKYF